MLDKEILLTIDSTSKIWSVSIFADEIELQTFVGDEVTPLSKFLVPKINEIIVHNNLKVKNISQIGICVGPGSFTGLRVGISVARGMSQVIGCQSVGVSLLELLRFSSKKEIPQNKTASLITTNQNQVYFQLAHTKDKTVSPEEIGLINTDSFFAEYFGQNEVSWITNQESFNKLSQFLSKEILLKIQVAPSNLSQILGRELSKKSRSLQIRETSPIYL